MSVAQHGINQNILAIPTRRMKKENMVHWWVQEVNMANEDLRSIYSSEGVRALAERRLRCLRGYESVVDGRKHG